MVCLDLLKAALQEAGALAADETPSGSDTQLALTNFNFMLGAWSARRLLVRSTTQENFSLVAGTRSYTIGITGVFATSKPLAVVSALVRDSNNLDFPVKVVDEATYNSYGDKLIAQGRPEALFYDPGIAQQAAQLGTIFVSPIPDAGYTLFLEEQKNLVTISTPGATITFEAPYYEALYLNLALRLWRKFHDHTQLVPTDLQRAADDALRVIETMNATQVRADLDLPGASGVFNVWTGETT